MLFYTYSKRVHYTFPEPVPDLLKKDFPYLCRTWELWFLRFFDPKYVLPDRLNNKIFLEKRCCIAELTLQNSCLDDFWVFSQNTETFLSLGDAPDKVSENALIVIEMFVVLIYGRTNEFCRVNSATQHLFSWKSCFLESILP